MAGASRNVMERRRPLKVRETFSQAVLQRGCVYCGGTLRAFRRASIRFRPSARRRREGFGLGS